jgi:DNA-directed RNA polymerase subunit E'/Rpb7
MTMLQITKNICISPKDITDDINTVLLEKVTNTFLNKCSEDVGFILDISDFSIISNKLSKATSNINFKVRFRSNVFKPEVGDVLEGTVCIILDNGVFVSYGDLLKIYVKMNSDYELKKIDDNRYVYALKGRQSKTSKTSNKSKTLKDTNKTNTSKTSKTSKMSNDNTKQSSKNIDIIDINTVIKFTIEGVAYSNNTYKIFGTINCC